MTRGPHVVVRLALILTVLLWGWSAVSTQPTSAKNDGRLSKAFKAASQEFDVPYDLLVIVAYAESRFDHRNGEPSLENGYGLMHLVQNNQADTLGRAAQLLNVSPDVLKTSPEQNIRGGAALLRMYADEMGLTDLSRKDIAAWYGVLARYSTAADQLISSLYADENFALLNQGVRGTSPEGEEIEVLAREVKPKNGKPKKNNADSLAPDYAAPLPDVAAEAPPVTSNSATTASSVLWAPAAGSNYTAAKREKDYQINYVVIHITQGSYASALNWFQNPSSGVSAHYTIRSRDGQITQSVSEKNIAHHAGNWRYNQHSIGIEHEGYVSNPYWYTDAMYRASAALTRSICLKYGIPMDRAHIIGHNEVPGATNTDPGRYWNWTYYMQLVRNEV